MKAEFINKLIVTPLPDGVTWELYEDFIYITNIELPWGFIIKIPKGFITDFASIPKIFWPLLPRWHKYGPAAIVHDYLYHTKSIDRKTADLIFKEAMKVLGVRKWRYTVIYYAVRWFAGHKFNDNKYVR